MKTIPLEQVTKRMPIYCKICEKETPHEVNGHPPVKRDNLVEFCYNCLVCGDSKEVYAVHSQKVSLLPIAIPSDTHCYESTIPEEMKLGREGL